MIIPIMKIISAWVAVAIVSTFACPKGCSLSAGFTAILTVIKETITANRSMTLPADCDKTLRLPVMAPIDIFRTTNPIKTNTKSLAARLSDIGITNS